MLAEPPSWPSHFPLAHLNFNETLNCLKIRGSMISTFDFFFLAAVALVLLYLYLSRTLTYWKKRGIDQDDRGSLLFGTITDGVLGRKTVGEILTSVYEKFPGRKVVGWYKFRTPALIVRDPELVHKILVTDFNSFRNNDVFADSEIDPIMGNNIFVLRDEMWKKSRALITPAFTSGKIKAIYPTMVEVSTNLVAYLKRHPEDIHVKSCMSRYTAEIVARCGFGIEGNNLKESKPEMHELGKLIFEPDLIKNFKFLAFFTMPTIIKLLRLKMVPDKVLKFFDSLLKDVIVHRQENNIERNDLVQYLIEVKKKTIAVAEGAIESDIITRVYTDDDVLSGCIMFFIEVYETSALVANNILYQLAMNREVQDTLREEIDSTLAEGELTFEKLHAMPFLNSVFLETNRILPVTFHMQKLCTERYEVDIGKEKPLVIEKDTPIVLPIYGLHKDPVHWEEPDLFKPERFSRKEEAVAKAKGIYLPFGDGPRMCPGSRIATTVIKVAIVQIIANLEVLPTKKTPKKIEPDPNYFMIGHKGGIYLKFVERSR